MKKIVLVFIATLSLCLSPAFSADFQKGLDAYKTGDYATALKEWKPLAEQGYASVQYNLGLMYEGGKGIPQDYTEAVKWYTLAAVQGLAEAQNSLGAMHEGGKGIPQDYTEAVKWYTLAAKQGNTKAQYNLGGMYEDGDGIPQDYTEAVKWYTLAAKQGDASAQYNLGLMYTRGKGVPQDHTKAVELFTLAAVQRLVPAQYNLGVMHYLGKGIPQDYAVAVEWYTLAAKQGHTKAQYNLGGMYRRGNGVLQDNLMAYAWFNIALANGKKTASKVRDELAQNMNQADISKAQKIARECLASNYKNCGYHEIPLTGSRAAISRTMELDELDEIKADDDAHAIAQAASDEAQAQARAQPKPTDGVKTWEYKGRINDGTMADGHAATASVADDTLSILYFTVDDAFYLWFTYNGNQSFSWQYSNRAEIFIRTKEVSGNGRYESDYVFTGRTVAQPDKDPRMPQFVVTKLSPEDIRALKKFGGNDIGAGYFVGGDWKTYLFPGKNLWRSFEELAAAVNRTDLLQ